MCLSMKRKLSVVAGFWPASVLLCVCLLVGAPKFEGGSAWETLFLWLFASVLRLHIVLGPTSPGIGASRGPCDEIGFVIASVCLNGIGAELLFVPLARNSFNRDSL